MDRTKEQIKLYKESGQVKGNKLDTFFYLLMRDHLPAGVVSTIVKEADSKAEYTEFTNGYLAKYAKHLVKRLNNVKS
jgi:hypothetical protein